MVLVGPTSQEPVRERADARRNRLKVLAAAAALFAERGVDGVSMDDVAREAGVGKGTLFRRFGDKSGLAAALLDERERELQAALLTGPPPLGPGAAPTERLVAFLDAYLDYVQEHLALVRMSEGASPGARYRIGAYRFWHQHVALLVRQSRTGTPAAPGSPPVQTPPPDAAATAHALLATVSAEVLAGVGPEAWPQYRAAVLALAASAAA